MAQVYKKFSDSQVKEMIARYLAKEIKREHIQTVLDIKRRSLQWLMITNETAQLPCLQL